MRYKIKKYPVISNSTNKVYTVELVKGYSNTIECLYVVVKQQKFIFNKELYRTRYYGGDYIENFKMAVRAYELEYLTEEMAKITELARLEQLKHWNGYLND